MPSRSTLYAIAALPLLADNVTRDPAAFVVGIRVDGMLVVHGQPGRAVPAAAVTTYRDGSIPWTWTAVGATSPELRAVVAPHRWDDEATDANLVAADWTHLP